MDEKGIKTEDEQGFVESVGEKLLWSTRYIILTGVISSVTASVVLFVVGSWEIIETIYQNKIPKPGSYTGRINSEPVNNRKTLLGNKNA